MGINKLKRDIVIFIKRDISKILKREKIKNVKIELFRLSSYKKNKQS